MHIFSTSTQKFPELIGTKEAEVCIIGAGMAGLNLAFLLTAAGKKVIVLEAETVGHAQSIRSTAKITCLPGFFYHDLIERTGIENAKKVARMMRSALQKYADVIFHHQINCDFERLPFQLVSKDLTKIEKEAKALRDLGWTCTVDQQKKTALKEGAVLTLDNQAQFHPGLWMEHIARGLEIYEQSRVINVTDHHALTYKGQVFAQKIVFCDHYPFLNVPGFYFMKMHQQRSYVLALSNVPKEHAMVYCADEPVESLRFTGTTALYSGFSHPTGKGDEDVLSKMKESARQHFPDCKIMDEWAAQDCMTLDHLPYIGRFSAQKPNWYVATGFNKWGMIYSMVSAMILCDEIQGISHPDAEAFDSLRSLMNTPVNELKQSVNAAQGLFREFLTLPQLKLNEIPQNEGGIIEFDGMSLGVYRDVDDVCYFVSSRCPHMKCQLTWNGAEKSWDCPCHGSRYDRYGDRIEGPAESLSILLRKEKYHESKK